MALKLSKANRRAARARRSWLGVGLTQVDWRLLVASKILCENDNGIKVKGLDACAAGRVETHAPARARAIARERAGGQP